MKGLRLLLWALLLAPAALAQTSTWEVVRALPHGTNVKLAQSSGGSVQGQLESATADGVVLTLRTGQRMVLRQQIARLSIRKPSHRGRNTLIAMGLGGAAGLGVAAVVTADQGGGSIRGWNLFNTLGPASALLGMVVGVAIPTGGWRAVYEPH
jgi:hypothetical protein